jgi:hypothetical protein
VKKLPKMSEETFKDNSSLVNNVGRVVTSQWNCALFACMLRVSSSTASPSGPREIPKKIYTMPSLYASTKIRKDSIVQKMMERKSPEAEGQTEGERVCHASKNMKKIYHIQPRHYAIKRS